MSESARENKRLREALLGISREIDADAHELRKMADDALKVVPFKIDNNLADNALVIALKIHRERIEEQEKTIKSMLSFLEIWKNRETKMGNRRVAEAIQLTIESYTCRK